MAASLVHTQTASKAWNTIKRAYAAGNLNDEIRAAILEFGSFHETQRKPRLGERTKFAQDLGEVLERRAYLIALKEHCQQLPFLSAAFPGSSIDDVFVDLPARLSRPTSSTGDLPDNLQASDFIKWMLSRAEGPANVACFGGAGSGKSTLSRSLVGAHCERILSNEDWDAGHLPPLLPAYVRAADLVDLDRPLVESLKAAVERELGHFLKAPLDATLFEFRPEHRTRRWLVVVDGVDEIVDREKQLRLLRAIRATGTDGSKAFTFFVSSRDNTIAHEVLGQDFHALRLEHISTKTARSLFSRYFAALGCENLHTSLPGAPLNELQATLATPLLIAIASCVLSTRGPQQTNLSTLFEDFVKTLLTKRGFAQKTSDDMRELLCDIAEVGERITIDEKFVAKSEQLGILPPGQPTFIAKQVLLDRLQASGLVLTSGGAVRFVHASFRQFFRASRFTNQVKPDAAAWRLLDPYSNGWDFVQFVFEKWSSRGHDLSSVSRELLSYGTEGLKLFSRLAGQTSRLPNDLVSAAIAKWRVVLEEGGPGFIDGAVDNLSIMGRKYDAALVELRRIAFDHWNYFEDSIEAAKYLARHNQIEDARKALIRIAEAEHPPPTKREQRRPFVKSAPPSTASST